MTNSKQIPWLKLHNFAGYAIKRKGYILLQTYGRVAFIFRTNLVIECNVKC